MQHNNVHSSKMSLERTDAEPLRRERAEGLEAEASAACSREGGWGGTRAAWGSIGERDGKQRRPTQS